MKMLEKNTTHLWFFQEFKFEGDPENKKKLEGEEAELIIHLKKLRIGKVKKDVKRRIEDAPWICRERERVKPLSQRLFFFLSLKIPL